MDTITFEHETFDRNVFGFWVYLMTDCILFATLFATYAVLHNNTAGGPSSKELYDLPFALKETLILLLSSFTSGLSMLAAYRKKTVAVLIGLGFTFLLGILFLAMELYEFHHLIEEGNSWQRSAFLSSYFTLVGCHGLHITCGLFWMAVMMIVVFFRGITISTLRRLTCLSMFWHFLDVIWIFIFSIVYLMGVI
jgi:cytochrome o ubiquinol oxidase subunit 3